MTKDEFLQTAISEKRLGDAACGVGDPYPHDVRSQMALEAFFALGGTEEEVKQAWKESQ